MTTAAKSGALTTLTELLDNVISKAGEALVVPLTSSSWRFRFIKPGDMPDGALVHTMLQLQNIPGHKAILSQIGECSPEEISSLPIAKRVVLYSLFSTHSPERPSLTLPPLTGRQYLKAEDAIRVMKYHLYERPLVFSHDFPTVSNDRYIANLSSLKGRALYSVQRVGGEWAHRITTPSVAEYRHPFMPAFARDEVHYVDAIAHPALAPFVAYAEVMKDMLNAQVTPFGFRVLSATPVWLHYSSWEAGQRWGKERWIIRRGSASSYSQDNGVFRVGIYNDIGWELTVVRTQYGKAVEILPTQVWVDSVGNYVASSRCMREVEKGDYIDMFTGATNRLTLGVWLTGGGREYLSTMPAARTLASYATNRVQKVLRELFYSQMGRTADFRQENVELNCTDGAVLGVAGWSDVPYLVLLANCVGQGTQYATTVLRISTEGELYEAGHLYYTQGKWSSIRLFVDDDGKCILPIETRKLLAGLDRSWKHTIELGYDVRAAVEHLAEGTAGRVHLRATPKPSMPVADKVYEAIPGLLT